MKKQRRTEKDGLIITTFGGRHTYKDAIDALDELLEIKKGEKRIYEIVINDDDIEVDITRLEEDFLSSKVKFTFEKFERGALAVVAGNAFVFGLSRMLASNIENEKIAVSVFRTEILARKWIQEMRELHSWSNDLEG